MSGTVSEPALTSPKLRTNNNRKCYFLTESKPDYYSVFLFYSSDAHLNVVHGFRLRPKLSRPATDPEDLLACAIMKKPLMSRESVLTEVGVKVE